ncbi:MAG: hypothetical protein KF745_10155 [Phycisphaeraceae bacterium]|nr:hypothetical protein [Phycisphaeraceae bacterium]
MDGILRPPLLQLVLIAAACGLPATIAPAAPPATPPSSEHKLPSVPVTDLAGRLAALSPDDPMPYFLLGEEVLSESLGRRSEPNQAGLSLARRLFILSYSLDQRLPKPRQARLGPSACLALAASVTDDAQRRWLWALARSMDPAIAKADRSQGDPAVDAVREDVALDLCTALGFMRAGEGRRAEAVLRRPGVSELLDRYDAMISPMEIRGGADLVRRLIAQWPSCPECKNRRVVNRPGDPNGRPVLCLNCGGNPGPRFSDDELLAQLRLESALLSGIQRSWAAQVVVDRGAPLRDLGPAELAPAFGVDPALCIFRDGQWTAPAAPAADAPEANPAAAPPPTPPAAAPASTPVQSSD